MRTVLIGFHTYKLHCLLRIFNSNGVVLNVNFRLCLLFIYTFIIIYNRGYLSKK